MSRVCQVTGKKPLVGSNVSHSNRHTKKRSEINLLTKRFWLEDEKRFISLRVTAHALRSVEHRGGLDAFLAKAHEDDLAPNARILKRDIAKKSAAAAA